MSAPVVTAQPHTPAAVPPVTTQPVRPAADTAAGKAVAKSIPRHDSARQTAPASTYQTSDTHVFFKEYSNELAFIGLLLAFAAVFYTDNFISKWWLVRRRARQKKRQSSAIHNAFAEDLPNATQYFQSHRLQEPNPTGRHPWHDLPGGADSVAYFLNEFLHPDHRTQPRVYLVLGPTGIGKTTFLQNLYAQYAENTKYIDAPDLLMGPLGGGYGTFYTKYLAERLKPAGNAQDTILLLDALDEYRYQHKDRGAARAEEAYEQEFAEFWSSFQDQVAPGFRKVVITVREQFFQTWREQNPQT
ncbi:MAG: ATP-binding protein, partial [Hymenobacter sp.]